MSDGEIPTANGNGLRLVEEMPTQTGPSRNEATIEQLETLTDEEMPTDAATSPHEEKPICVATVNEQLANGRATVSESESANDSLQEIANATSDELDLGDLESESETGHAEHGGVAIVNVNDGLFHAFPS